MSSFCCIKLRGLQCSVSLTHICIVTAYFIFSGFAASLWVLFTQLLYPGVLSFINWVFFCTKGCPTFSTNELVSVSSKHILTWWWSQQIFSAMFQSIWGLGCFVALVVIAIALSVIAAILTCFNWIAVYWILTEDNIYQGRKYLQDIYKHSGIVCIISFIGLSMLVLLGVLPSVLDESQLDIYYYAWVCKLLYFWPT